MLASVERVQAKASAPQAETSHAAPADSRQDDAATEDSAGQTESAPGQAARKKPEAPVPFATFQERLAREKAKQQRIQEALDERHLELARRDEAIKLLSSELDALKARIGAQDPRDEQLREYQLKEAARQAFERVQEEHRAKLAEQREQAAMAEKRQAAREQLHAACAQYPGVDFEALRTAMLKSQNGDAFAVARQLHERLRSLFTSSTEQRPQAPPHVRGGSANAVRPPNNRAGMEELVRSIFAKG